MLPSFLALFACDAVGLSAFLFTAIDVLVVVAAAVVVLVAAAAAFVDVMGFIVAETGFTGAISTFSGDLSKVLNTKMKKHSLNIFFLPFEREQGFLFVCDTEVFN